MINYLKKLSIDQTLLWCYLIWYLAIIVIYFDSDLNIWLSAIGIAVIVGFALLLSTSCWPIHIKSLDRWKTFRLFFIPFCVSSYSSTISQKGFILLFPPDLKTNSIAIIAILSFLILVTILQKALFDTR